MAAGKVITDAGKIYVARLLKGDNINGLTHCAWGDGDATFTDPDNPPSPSALQGELVHECCRKRFSKRVCLIEDEGGSIVVDGVTYREAALNEYSPIIGIFFTLSGEEGTGFTMKEYGFFGGWCEYMPDVSGYYAVGGKYDADTNPTGEVLYVGAPFEVATMADFTKNSDMELEFVAVVRL